MFFLQQDQDNIIERFEVEPEYYKHFKWLPHRPIIRSADQITTKIRPVFNFSLKKNYGYFLNGALCVWINLMINFAF